MSSTSSKRTQRANPVQAGPAQAASEQPEPLDTHYLEGLIGYNARRAALTVIGVFLERMAPYGLRPVEFSTLSLIHHNPGVTARQLCHSLGLQPSNMVGTISAFEQRGLIERRPHPKDGRAQGLHLTAPGQSLMQQAEATAAELENEAAHKLSAAERKRLMALLQKIYL
ncbi:MAG: MarR family winged helix-turn-helix transcriptional regulator [Betaproteobacteria bacterium]